MYIIHVPGYRTEGNAYFKGNRNQHVVRTETLCIGPRQGGRPGEGGDRVHNRRYK